MNGIQLLFFAIALAALPTTSQIAGAVEPAKRTSSLYPPEVVARVRENIETTAWAAQIRDDVVEGAERWINLSDDALWDLMFGATITRSWMVWSNGFCPACKQSVPMYNWKMDAMGEPWKVRCPHCNEAFPKNDFQAFYRSGLDAHGVFDPAKADRSLLFNTEHPNEGDPLRAFGVDDGEGYVEGDNHWRFIGAYLIYGQWKQAVVGGIRVLSAAYLLTGNAEYAHNAAVMLDRVADLYPTFDFGKQALVYEVPGDRGYVSTWHDACEETRELAMAYDMIFEALPQEDALVAFLSRKAAEYGIENPKASFADIQRNIENRILRDAIANRPKITTNYPRTEIAVAILWAILGWDENRDAFWNEVTPMLERATAVDGITGEKGLAGYACFTIQALGMFLAEFTKSDPSFLPTLLQKQPRLRETFRFHIDTRCLGRYYPLSGDTGWFAGPMEDYVGVNFLKPGCSEKSFSGWTLAPPSMFTFMWDLYTHTGDPAYVQTLYVANGSSYGGVPHDLYAHDSEAVQRGVQEVIVREGAEIRLGSVNKTQWHLAILRSGEGAHARALWLDYDSGGGHGHQDGMNLGFFTLGLDVMPEFGYPPVQYGGWGSPRARWYTMTAAHNTVAVDGANSASGAGETTLWADGRLFHAIGASGPALNGGNRYDRTVALIDISPEACYAFDVFRVANGADHTKFFHSHFGEVSTSGLNLESVDDYGHDTQMRHFRADPAPQLGWSAEWHIEDHYDLLPEDRDMRVRYVDFTSGAEAGLCEAWIVSGSFNSTKESWIPRVFTRRRSHEGEDLKSTFVALIEPCTGESAIASARRVTDGLPSDAHVVLEVKLRDGRTDIIMARDPADTTTAEVAAPGDPPVVSSAELCLVRLDASGTLEYVALANGGRFIRGAIEMAPAKGEQFVEWGAQEP
ncbi:MAG TPA: heparinase II/III family protein [Candidatus Hydrogenedentes bacterium]|nr:heparinase II/III family protein [Candidatus Hydrogenedentota bacterium]HPG69001.1 heparinase II/III family protein [Candidatus Hydrogenedentota bacterium]